MTDKEQNGFDLEVRSILENAQLRPPKRVWRNLSTMLENAGSGINREFVAWTGVSIAFAACLLAGIFMFRNPKDTIPTHYYNTAEPLTAQVVSEASDGIRSVQPQTPAIGQSRPTAGYRQDVTVSDDVPVIEDITTAKDEDNVTESSDGFTDSSEREAAKPVRSVPDRRRIDSWVDPSEEESGSFKRRISIFAQGMVGGNDSDISFNNNYALMAPGSANTNEGGVTELSESTYGVPFSIGLGVRFALAPRLSIGTGLDFSLLTRTFTGKYSETTGNALHSMSYLGIPLYLYYNIIDAEKINFYAFGGGQMEFCLSNKYTIYSSPNIVATSPVGKPQISAGLGLGVEFRLTGMLGLYLDPGIYYYFHCDQPKNIHTDKPLMFNFNAGLRFNL